MEEINSQNSDLGLQGLDKLEAKAQAENTKGATNCMGYQKIREMVR